MNAAKSYIEHRGYQPGHSWFSNCFNVKIKIIVFKNHRPGSLRDHTRHWEIMYISTYRAALYF